MMGIYCVKMFFKNDLKNNLNAVSITLSFQSNEIGLSLLNAYHYRGLRTECNFLSQLKLRIVYPHFLWISLWITGFSNLSSLCHLAGINLVIF